MAEGDFAATVLVLEGRRPLELVLSTDAAFYRAHLRPAEGPRPRARRGPLAPLALMLDGARLTDAVAVAGDRVLALGLVARDRLGRPRPLLLVHELFGPRANLLLLDADRRILWRRHERGPAVGDPYPRPLASEPVARLLESPFLRRLPDAERRLVEEVLRGERPCEPTRFPPERPVLAYVAPVFPGGRPYPTLSAALADAYGELEARRRREILLAERRKELAARRAALERRLARKEAELAAGPDPDELRRQGELLLAYGWSLPPGATSLEAEHWEDGRRYVVPLPEGADPAAAAQACFRQYERARRRRERLVPEIARDRAELGRLEAAWRALALSGEAPEAPLPAARAGRSGPEGPLRFRTSGGHEVLVGRSGRQNDELTFKVAQADEFFVHAKDIPGAHVILRTTRPGDADVLEACLLAAHFSRARQGANVPVDVTRRRYVRKPRGAPPGYVVYERQETHFVTPSGPRLEALLRQQVAAEEDDGTVDGYEPT